MCFTTCICDFTMPFETCIQDGFQWLDHKHHQVTNWHMCKSSRGFQNEQLEAQNGWLVTSSMDKGENKETYADKRLGKKRICKGLGWWLSTCNIGDQYNNCVVYNHVGD